jgi:hypothetical protein
LTDAIESSDWIIPGMMEHGARFAPDLIALEYTPPDALVSSARAMVQELATDSTFRARAALTAVVFGLEREEERTLRDETARILAMLENS